MVHKRQQLTLSTLGQHPQYEMVIGQICMEGLTAIVAWGGMRLGDVLRLAGVWPVMEYVAFKSADRYFETWDLRKGLHPRTSLATQMIDAPLPAANGAPLRLSSLLKVGYKLSKWITTIHVLGALNTQRLGACTDHGYEWFAGL